MIPYTKKGRLLAKVVQKHEHRTYVDPLASIPFGRNIVQELGYIVAMPFMLNVL